MKMAPRGDPNRTEGDRGRGRRRRVPAGLAARLLAANLLVRPPEG